MEGVFSVSNVTLDFEKDKVLVSDPDLKYLSLMAAFLAKTPPVSVELYVWIKVRNYLTFDQIKYTAFRRKKTTLLVDQSQMQCTRI